MQVPHLWVKRPNKPAGISAEATDVAWGQPRCGRKPGSCGWSPSSDSSKTFGPKAQASPPDSCFPQAPGSLMWVSALADTMKCCYMLLLGCSMQGVNPKIHPAQGRGSASALPGAVYEAPDEKWSLFPFDEQPRLPGSPRQGFALGISCL